MRVASFILTFIFLIVGCTAKLNDENSTTAQRTAQTTQESCASGKCPCDTPLGSIEDGSKVTVYSQSTASCELGCGVYAEDIICQNGKFNKDISQLQFKCEVLECPACTLGNNLIQSGETVKAYSASSVGCAESCDDIAQERICLMGTLSGDSSYSNLSCERKTCRCNLPDNSGYLSLGGQIKLYSQTTASCGTSCDSNFSQIRNCISQVQPDNSVTYQFDGSSNYIYQSCTNATGCSCALPDGSGRTVPDGSTFPLSSVSSVACGDTCGAHPQITVLCQNGQFLDPSNANQVIDFTKPQYSSYQYSCQAQTCQSCPIDANPAHNIADGQSYSFAKSSSVACTDQCQYQTRTCSNGQFLGDASYSVPGAGSCSQQACGCQVPNMPGTTLSDGDSATLTDGSVLACGQSCDQVPSIKLTCHNGSLYDSNGSALATVPSNFNSFCSVAGCADCSLLNYSGTITNNQSITLYSSSTACGNQLAAVTFNFSCQNGVLVRNGSAYSPASDPNLPAHWYSTSPTCPGCQLPWGTYLAPGTASTPSTAMGYKFSGTVVNPCGKGCKSTQFTCTPDGKLIGDTSYNKSACDNTCNQPGGGAPPRVCLLPWQNSYVTPDSQIPLWNQKTVGCGDSCQNHFKLAKCQMMTGTFDATFDYIYPACTEVCP